MPVKIDRTRNCTTCRYGWRGDEGLACTHRNGGPGRSMLDWHEQMQWQAFWCLDYKTAQGGEDDD